MHMLFQQLAKIKLKKKILVKSTRFVLALWFIISNFLFGFPIDYILKTPVVIQQAKANSNTYDFTDCGSTCDTDTGWWASDDDVDQFPFGGVTANRNTHAEADDTNYSNMANSDDTYAVATNPSTGDEVFSWFEMTITETPSTIKQLDFTFEGYPNTTASPFQIYVKTAAGAYESDASWTALSGPTTIAAGTDTTITRTLKDNITDYIDGNGKIVWGVYQSVSALTVNIDYAKIDVTYHPVDLEGYRWRNDDGNETGATWLADQDSNITQPTATNTRLRTLINSTGTADPDTSQYKLEYKRSTDSTYVPVEVTTPTDVTPTIESWSSGASTTTNASTHAITMPSGITAGDLLIIVFSTDGVADITITAGDWIELSQAQGSGVSSGIFYKFATGSDTATVATGSEQTSHIVYRISGASMPYIAQTTGNSTNSDPPNLDTGTSRNYLWLATATHDSTVVASAAPTNYSNLHTQAAAGTGGASTSTAERAATASSENPGTFTSNTEQWVSFTIAIPSSSMGIHCATAPTTQGTTSVVINYPTDIAVGDLMVLGIANKHTPNGPTTPTGWTAASNYQASGSGGIDGLDSGSVYSSVYYRIVDGTEKGTFTVSVPSGNASIGRILTYRKEVGKEWDVAMSNGSDNTPDTSWSITAGSDPGITAGDMVLAVSAMNTDPYGYNTQTLAATGVTFDSAEKEVGETNSTAGNDLEIVFSNHFAISGTSSAAPTYTMTASGSTASGPAGATVFVRIRQRTAPITLSASTHITASGDNTTALLTPPAGKTTGDFLTGRMQDDENPADTINLSSSQYTELEWNIIATSTAVNDEIYQFRVTVGGVPITTYSVTPQWTIGTAGTADLNQIHYRWRNDDGTEGSSGWYDSNWVYRKKLTIDNTDVAGSSNLTNFPVLINYTHADLKDTTNSGHVAQSDAGDILFTNSAGTKLDHEITKYVPSTGQVIAWVEVDVLDYDDDTEIYMYYGYGAASDQWNISGTWSNGYVMVQHFNETSGTHFDSTSNNNDSTSVTVTTQGTATAQIDGADDFNGSNNYVAVGDSNSLDVTNFTISGWFSIDTFPGTDQYNNILDKQAYFLEVTDNDEFDCGVYDGSFSEHNSGTANLSTGTYYYLACAYDDTGDTVRLYKNSTEVLNEAATKTPATNNIDIGIYALSGNLGQQLDGQADELVLSNVARSADWLNTEYNNQSNPGVGGFLTSIGTEETEGTGATWLANEDTAVTDIAKETNVRIRFMVSNEGGATSDATAYQLEVAETGTCSGGTYAAVPTDTSGDWQVSASAHFTDGDPTTNIASGLADENTTFVAGQIKDTGNTTGNITLADTEFTEIEFSIQATTNATDGGSYCFRLNGADTFTEYAQATLEGGASPVFSLSAYRFYDQTASENVTNPWGNPTIAENTLLALLPATNTPPGNREDIRLRVGISVSTGALSATSQQFKLQYKSGTDANCTTGSWTDVGTSISSETWRYSTTGITDGTTLTALKLSGSDVLGVYVKSNPSATNPNAVAVGETVEYDFNFKGFSAASATTYSFRVVESDGTPLTTYTYCPTLTTKAATEQELRHGNVFSNETEQGFTRAN